MNTGLTISNGGYCAAAEYSGGGNRMELAIGGIARSSGATVLFNRSSGARSDSIGYILTTRANTAELVVCAAANAITIAAPMQNNGSTAGTLIKAGSSNLTLSAGNTYTGDTWVNEGTLALADNAGLTFKIGGNGTNNCIRGSGTLTLDGDFYFDLSGAGKNVGDSWTIVDKASLTATFTANFTVNGFRAIGSNKWNGQTNGSVYEFDKATGVLTVVGKMGTVFMMR